MEPSSGLTYLFAAYTVFWVVLAAYVARLRHRQRALWTTLERLEKRAAAASPSEGGSL